MNKMLPLALLASIAALVFAACGGAEEPGPAAQPAPAAPAAPAEAAAQAAPGAPAAPAAPAELHQRPRLYPQHRPPLTPPPHPLDSK